MRLVRLALAVWRINSLVQREDGPFRICVRFREAMGSGWDLEGSAVAPAPGLRAEVARAIECHWCLSVWAGFAAAILDRYASVLIDGLAASAAVILAEQARLAVGSQHGSSTDPDMAAAG